MPSLFDAAFICLLADTPADKLRLSRETAAAWQSGRLDLQAKTPPQALPVPGRPVRPVLVSPRELPRRRLGSSAGQAALLHAVAHIEFNAINLAWDAVYRFRELPTAYYDDWARIAAEEALHFELIETHLRTLGYGYGDFPAHNGLWEMALDTAHDVLARMALVPRVLEARGLDVNPGMRQKLAGSGDAAGAALLDIILRDEIGHVAAGTRWFHYLCAQRQQTPLDTFRALIEQHLKGRVKAPLNAEARLAAGFSLEELTLLQNMANS